MPKKKLFKLDNKLKKKITVSLAVVTFVIFIIFGSFGSFWPNIVNLASELGLSGFVIDDTYLSTKNYGDAYAGIVSKVRDGDTLELSDGEVVRLLYIDTPETVKSGSPVECYGPEASEYTKSLIGQEIWLISDIDDKDRYGRSLRLIYLKQEDLGIPENSFNASLVKLGLARASFYSPNTTFKPEFESMEVSARQKKLGLWGSCQY